MMDEARKMDKLMRQLKSAQGEVVVDSLVQLQTQKEAKEFALKALEKMLEDGTITCNTPEIEGNSLVKISETGAQLMYKGGYRRKYYEETREEDYRPEPILPYIFYFLLFLGFIALLIYLIPIIWKL